MMKSTDMRSHCPISSSLDILGDKWSLLIVRDLMLHRSRTYGDFSKSAENIATNILATRLQQLENHGIIIKLPYPGNKVKTLYQLSPKGIALIPALIELALWGGQYIPDADDNSPFLQEAKKNKTRFTKKIMAQLMAEEKDPK